MQLRRRTTTTAVLKQFRRSSSEGAVRTRHYEKGSPTDSRERRPRTRCRTCLLRDSTGTGRAKKAPPNASTVQSTRTCADHPAHSQAQRRQLRDHCFGGIATPMPKRDHKAGSQPHFGPRQSRPEWHGDVTNKSNNRSGTNDFHAQRAEGESGAGEAASGPRE